MKRTTSSYVTANTTPPRGRGAVSIGPHPGTRRLDAPTKPRRLHRRVPQPDQLVGQLQQGDRAASHLERGDVGADQVPRDRDAAALQVLRNLVVDDVQLDQR